jgi:diketogulonate reductase-like aldo/keto reductase
MVNPDELSPVGFGCYRLSSSPHAAALEMALDAGCNLIDTAATYTGGRSECLVGATLAAHRGVDAFVVTKAGYDDEPDGPHCMSPDFLSRRLSRSCERLGRTTIDAFLLHNPERLLEADVGAEELVEQVAAAFLFLEECVESGRIRFYGVSSNVLAAPLVPALDLKSYVEVASGISSNHHFRFIQFPCNLLERAAMESDSGLSLAARARSSGLVTLANRPLNALRDGSVLRLVSYDEVGCDAPNDRVLHSAFQAVIGERLVQVGQHEDPLEFGVIRYIAERWTELETTEVVDQLFGGLLQAFLNQLYGGLIPAEDAQVFTQLYRAARRHARRNQGVRSASVARELRAGGVLGEPDGRSVQVQACDYLLDHGLDHVLVGMRDAKYVADLRPLFLKADRPGVPAGFCHAGR